MATIVLRVGNHGAGVLKVQEALLAQGIPLPRFGADSWYGDETETALFLWAAKHGYKKVPGVLTTDIHEALVKAAKGTRHDLPEIPACFRDTRTVHSGHARLGPRPWSAITGITLHQTSTCLLPDGETSIDKVARAIKRASDIGVHHVVLRNGISVWSNPYDQRMPQAQRVFNASDVGVEIDGYFAGVEGDDNTFWRPKSEPNRKPMSESVPQFAAARETCRFVIAHVAANGGKIKYIHAHRQTSGSRISDPGELIWREIAEPIIEEYGLSFGGADFYVPALSGEVEKNIYSGSGPGYPIPREWSPRGKHGYRQRPARPDKQSG